MQALRRGERNGERVMHNEYDNEKFFQEYAKMPRSRDGLCSAGEWHQLKPLFPPLDGKNVLDLGKKVKSLNINDAHFCRTKMGFELNHYVFEFVHLTAIIMLIAQIILKLNVGYWK